MAQTVGIFVLIMAIVALVVGIRMLSAGVSLAETSDPLTRGTISQPRLRRLWRIVRNSTLVWLIVEVISVIVVVVATWRSALPGLPRLPTLPTNARMTLDERNQAGSPTPQAGFFDGTWPGR
jgi:hypothetical protein